MCCRKPPSHQRKVSAETLLRPRLSKIFAKTQEQIGSRDNDSDNDFESDMKNNP